jgi:hypothetical protein
VSVRAAVLFAKQSKDTMHQKRHKFFPEGSLSSLFVKGRRALYDLEVATAIHASPAGTYSAAAISTKAELEKKAKEAKAMSGILAEHLFLEDGDSNGPKNYSWRTLNALRADLEARALPWIAKSA